MDRNEWIESFAAEIGVPAPGEKQIEAILELAATAAHASERTAAPVASWLAGISGRPLSELVEAAEQVSS